jgi:hypothetical protein
MAYSLRYYYENTLADGGVVRLEIHEKNGTKPAMPIGEVVQGLSLQIQGNEADIIAPIATTLLTMTFIDAPDHADADTHKCGDWMEFYTPDSTYWKVILLGKSPRAAVFRTLWGGYVTPDSYEEELTYRGSVTIVARDNIGHLADFPFETEGDEYGTISLRQLLSRAWDIIESPMAFIYDGDWMQTEGVSALETRFNISAFENKSWHDVIEAVLYAYGAVLRFVGDNRVKVCPLRDMPKFHGTIKHFSPTFVSGATRMLSPAVKKVEEIVDYQIEEAFQPLVEPSDYSGAKLEVSDGTGFTGTVYPLLNNEVGKNWMNPSDDSPTYFNAESYGFVDENMRFTEDEKKSLRSSMMLLCNNNAGKAIFSKYCNPHDFVYKVVFGSRYYAASDTMLGKYNQDYCKITSVKYAVRIVANGVTEYMQKDGTWSAAMYEHTITSTSHINEFEVRVSPNHGVCILVELLILQVGIVESLSSGYVVISSVSISRPEDVAMLSTNRVITNYNTENNVVIKRDPVIAPAYNSVVLPAIIKNGIFYKEGQLYKPAIAWAWEGDSPQQMALYNHFQTLCYYIKPNNVLEGTIVNADLFSHACIWNWKGAEHILVGGSYDFLSGMIRGAILRQFARYEDQVYVHVAKDAVFVPQKGIVLDVSIICWNMISWSVSGLPDWITASQMSGTGSAELQFTIAANNTGEVRVAQIHIERAVLTITQKDRMGDFGVDYSLDYW